MPLYRLLIFPGRPGHLGAQSFHYSLDLLDYLGMLCGDVILFPKVPGKIEQFKSTFLAGNYERSISPTSEHFASESVALMVKNTDFDPDEYSLEAMGENKTRKSKKRERLG